MADNMKKDHSPTRSPTLKSPSSKDGNPKLSPILPLAPLEYLQNQRRGSITDPSLHAAPLSQKQSPHSLPPFRPPSDPSPSYHSPSALIKDNYTFGDATPRATTSENNNNGSSSSSSNNTQLRKLLRSPSLDQPNTLINSITSPNGNGASECSSIDSDMADIEGRIDTRRMSVDPLAMRRPSTAGPESQVSTLHGTKRKMSSDRGLPGVEDIDVSGMQVDREMPAPKRRGSAVDARIGKLSLNDRRNSVDSRVTTGNAGSSSSSGGNSIASITTTTTTTTGSSIIPSIFSNLSAFSSAFPGAESPQGRAPPSMANFAWTNSHPPPENISPMHHQVDPNSRPPFDQNPSHQIPMMPPLNFPAERRMSAPDVAPTAGPTRALRSRSRPPSRQMRAAETSNPQQPGSPTQEDASSPASALPLTKAVKEPGSTPYSRSPELRVSHKLAERKRRKEMKDLFDELRDQLPADRGMKASKWEILSKAIDFVSQLKQSHQDMAREIEMLRGELDVLRQNPAMAQFPPGAPPPPHTVVYSQGPPVPGPYAMHPHPGPPGAPPGVLPHPQPQTSHPPHPPQQPPLSRPASSQNVYPPGAGPNVPPPPGQPQQNGTMTRTDVPPT